MLSGCGVMVKIANSDLPPTRHPKTEKVDKMSGIDLATGGIICWVAMHVADL